MQTSLSLAALRADSVSLRSARCRRGRHGRPRRCALGGSVVLDRRPRVWLRSARTRSRCAPLGAAGASRAPPALRARRRCHVPAWHFLLRVLGRMFHVSRSTSCGIVSDSMLVDPLRKVAERRGPAGLRGSRPAPRRGTGADAGVCVGGKQAAGGAGSPGAVRCGAGPAARDAAEPAAAMSVGRRAARSGRRAGSHAEDRAGGRVTSRRLARCKLLCWTRY